MNVEKIKVCWNCQKIYPFRRKTSHYCCDVCRVQDNIKRSDEINTAILKLKAKQFADRAVDSHWILKDYKEKNAKK